MAVTPTRDIINDANTNRHAFREQTAEIAQVDTFAPLSSTGVSDSQAFLQTVAKFGTKVGAAEFQKEQSANFVRGQGLAASGQELTGSEPAPTRKGFEAMSSKLSVDAWSTEMLAAIDNGGNDLDPSEWNTQAGESFKGLLTGDAQADKVTTLAGMEAMNSLATYQVKANKKKRTADAITQATVNTTGALTAVKSAMDKGDPALEAEGRRQLLASYDLPAITNPELKTQTQLDLAILGLESGDATGLQYLRENGIELDIDQERAVLKGEAKYNGIMNRKADVSFQRDTAEFEVNLSTATSDEQIKELIDQHQDQYGSRKTNEYYIAKDVAAKKARFTRVQSQYLSTAYKNGTLANQKGVTTKQIGDSMRAYNTEVYADPTLSPAEKEAIVVDKWKSNGLIDTDFKRSANAGLGQLIDGDGKLSASVEASYEDTYARWKSAPDLTLRHLDEKQRNNFLHLKSLTEQGGMPSLFAAAAMLEHNKATSSALSKDQRSELRTELTSAAEDVAGKGFFQWAGEVTGLVDEVENIPHVRQQMEGLAKAYLAGGYTDVEDAVEAARIQMMTTGEQLGKSFVNNGGVPIHTQMGVSPDRMTDAYEHGVARFLEENPDLKGQDNILLGDPHGKNVIYATLNEFGVIQNAVPLSLTNMGAAFNADVIATEEAKRKSDEAAAVLVSEDRRNVIDQAVKSGMFIGEAEEAYDNIGSAMWYNLHRDLGLDPRTKEMVEAQVTTQDELKDLKRAEFIHTKGPEPVLTPEQKAFLAGETPTPAVQVTDTDTTSPEAFVTTSQAAATEAVAGTSLHPDVVLAISAQETGYGKQVKGNNFFGIKGEGQKFTTHEVIDGKRVKVKGESFKKFDNFADAASGLVEFLQTNPRYAEVFKATTPEAQIEALAEAGYATDPKYKENLLAVLKGVTKRKK